MTVMTEEMKKSIASHLFMGNGGGALGFGREIIVDNFAGGGGASTGIEMAMGRSVDIAINHDPDAIAMHAANHPDTEHYCESVWDVDPVEAVRGRPVGLAWFSPDCKHFSKAKGGKPVNKEIRGLAWISVKWAALVRPRVMMLENVEEFKDWGPVDEHGQPIKERKGETFAAFVACLSTGLARDHPAWAEIREALGDDFPYHLLEQGLGFDIGHRELRACDYGAPTIRKRFFMVMKCDGTLIVWPEPTHGDQTSKEVKSGKLLPWRTAAEIIDWSLPCRSIFGRKKPLAENTMRRIARGIQKFVIDNPKPFIIKVNHTASDGFRGQKMDEPLQTITAKNGWGVVTPFIARIGQTGFGGDRLAYGMEKPLTTITTKAEHLLVAPVIARQFGESIGHAIESPLGTVTAGGGGKSQLVAAFLSKYHGDTPGSEARGQTMDKPLYTLDTSNRFALNVAYLAKHYGGNYTGAGSSLNEPLSTITAKDHNALVTSHLIKMRRTNIGQPVTEPLHTITAGGLHLGEVRAFLMKYYGTGEGQELNEPLHTVPTKDRFGLVIIQGEDGPEEWQIVDIGMRMLEPHELYAAQGFPPTYKIDRTPEGKAIPKSSQVARCGNAVPPPFAEQLVRANLPELCMVPGGYTSVANLQVKQVNLFDEELMRA